MMKFSKQRIVFIACALGLFLLAAIFEDVIDDWRQNFDPDTVWDHASKILSSAGKKRSPIIVKDTYA